MDIYYRGFDKDSPISTGSQHLAAAAARLLLAMLRSIQYMDDAGVAAFNKYITIDNIWFLSLILAGWLLSIHLGGPIGAAVGTILLYLGAKDLFDRLNDVYTPLKDWVLISYNAENDKDIDRAAQRFASGFANGFITAIEYMVINKIFRASVALLRTKFPPPDWIKTVWERTAGERSAKRGKKAGEDVPPDAVGQTIGVLQTRGAIRAAQGCDFPTGAVIAGVGLTLGAVVVVAAITRGDKK